MSKPDPNDAPVKRWSRGYLPHLHSPELLQYVTFRLANSLPRDIFRTLEYKLRNGQITVIEYHRSIERALDVGDGPTYLHDPRIALIVAETLLKLHRQKYDLYEWVVMPNHVHILLRILEPFTLSAVMHSIKGYTATAANRLLCRKGAFWSPEYFDRFIRDARHLAKVRRYISENPVKAGLCSTPEEWPWGSAGWRG